MRIDRIYNKYKSKLRGYISKQISREDIAEDMTQEVFYKFITADRRDPIEAVSSWLYKVAQNQITDFRRKAKEESMPYFTKHEEQGEFMLSLADLLSSDKDTPEHELLRSMVWEELALALHELPTEQRKVFEQTELQGFSFKEISQESGTAVNTLISRKRYAVLHLRERLKTLYQDLDML